MNEIPFLPNPVHLPGANIKVVGVGGAGCNALDRMIQSGVDGVQFIAMNTDQQSLAQSRAHVKIPLGPLSMRGLGAGGNAERGAVAAEESRDEILAQLQGADMVFITGGMGGGTGTGAAPIVASCAREQGALTVAVVLTPFRWEGVNKADKASLGLDNLRETADTVIVVSNEKLLTLCDRGVKMKEAYRVADGVLIQGVRGITDLILRPGTLNGDFADVEAVLRNGREALIGTGAGRGDEALLDALTRALDCPLLEREAQGSATQVIVSVMADWDRVELSAVETAMGFLSRHYHGLADIKLCQVEAPELEDRVLVTVLASGFQEPGHDAEPMPMATFDPPAQDRSGFAELPRQAYGDSGRVYGEAAAADAAAPMTPTRLLPQAPTPSGEMPGVQEDLHVPAIIRMTQGRLPIE
ncbi:MAG TPA: cell division protein FtsZ [Holophaga sp.]|nr:cell division protein FtsZ [Holophaga sp.]